MLDVLAFGEILWDIFEEARPRGAAMAKVLRPELGGAAANVAVALARLGVKVALVGGVAPSFLPYRHATADGAVTARHVTPAIGKARFVVLDTGAFLSPGRGAAAFLDAAAAARAKVVVDLNVQAHRWPSAAALKKAAIEPASAHGPFGEVLVAAERARCVDATGAGDAFLAGVLAAFLAAGGRRPFDDGALVADALALGHTLGAKAVSQSGAVTGLTGLALVRRTLTSLGRGPSPRTRSRAR